MTTKGRLGCLALRPARGGIGAESCGPVGAFNAIPKPAGERIGGGGTDRVAAETVVIRRSDLLTLKGNAIADATPDTG